MPRFSEFQPEFAPFQTPNSWDIASRWNFLRIRGGVTLGGESHRLRQFLSDCNNFLTGDENWAGRATELGWNAATLFGCHRARPLDHPGGAGLLWAINGGRLVELHRDWAVIELAANGSRHVFERRRVDAGKVTLPWIEGPGDVGSLRSKNAATLGLP